MIRTIVGNPNLTNLDSVICKKWPDCTGVDILASTVYSACKGVVIFVGCDMSGKYTITVQIDSKQSIRYCNLSSENVSPNDRVDEGTELGTVDKLVRVEYCTTEIDEDSQNTEDNPSDEEGREAIYVRIGSMTYYKHDPYDLLVGNKELTIVGISAYELAESGEFKDPTQLIKTEAITPFIATLSSSVTSINCSKLSEMGVVGVMLYGGGLYDTVHMVKKQYRNSNVKSQVAAVTKGKLSFGLYVDVRARSIDEAKKECQQLYYLISKYPPTLGLWLKLDLVKSNHINDSIIDVYREKIEKWGLKGQCGFYVTKNQLSKITWSKHQENFFLWLIHRTDRIEAIQELLTPDFFKLDKV